jgi:hypothetical protein
LQHQASDSPSQQGLLHGNTLIEPGGSDEDGEFSASSVDFESELSIGDGNSTTSDPRGDESITLRSSICEHSYANGRRYHRYRHGRYPIPNDEAEQSREDILHTMMLEATDGRLFYAPLEANPQRIIDLGTGTGLWAMEGMRGISVDLLQSRSGIAQPNRLPLGAC